MGSKPGQIFLYLGNCNNQKFALPNPHPLMGKNPEILGWEKQVQTETETL